MMWMAAAGVSGWTFFNMGADVIQQTYQGQSEKWVAQKALASIA